VALGVQAWEVDEQVAGYATKFKGFRFVTAHNAGHEVPSYQPKIALTLLTRFLSGDFA
jgi:serine carboxypeptidase-like clade 2